MATIAGKVILIIPFSRILSQYSPTLYFLDSNSKLRTSLVSHNMDSCQHFVIRQGLIQISLQRKKKSLLAYVQTLAE